MYKYTQREGKESQIVPVWFKFLFCWEPRLLRVSLRKVERGGKSWFTLLLSFAAHSVLVSALFLTFQSFTLRVYFFTLNPETFTLNKSWKLTCHCGKKYKYRVSFPLPYDNLWHFKWEKFIFPKPSQTERRHFPRLENTKEMTADTLPCNKGQQWWRWGWNWTHLQSVSTPLCRS